MGHLQALFYTYLHGAGDVLKDTVKPSLNIVNGFLDGRADGNSLADALADGSWLQQNPLQREPNQTELGLVPLLKRAGYWTGVASNGRAASALAKKWIEGYAKANNIDLDEVRDSLKEKSYEIQEGAVELWDNFFSATNALQTSFVLQQGRYRFVGTINSGVVDVDSIVSAAYTRQDGLPEQKCRLVEQISHFPEDAIPGNDMKGKVGFDVQANSQTEALRYLRNTLELEKYFDSFQRI